MASLLLLIIFVVPILAIFAIALEWVTFVEILRQPDPYIYRTANKLRWSRIMPPFINFFIHNVVFWTSFLFLTYSYLDSVFFRDLMWFINFPGMYVMSLFWTDLFNNIVMRFFMSFLFGIGSALQWSVILTSTAFLVNPRYHNKGFVLKLVLFGVFYGIVLISVVFAIVNWDELLIEQYLRYYLTPSLIAFLYGLYTTKIYIGLLYALIFYNTCQDFNQIWQSESMEQHDYLPKVLEKTLERILLRVGMIIFTFFLLFFGSYYFDVLDKIVVYYQTLLSNAIMLFFIVFFYTSYDFKRKNNLYGIFSYKRGLILVVLGTIYNNDYFWEHIWKIDYILIFLYIVLMGIYVKQYRKRKAKQYQLYNPYNQFSQETSSFGDEVTRKPKVF